MNSDFVKGSLQASRWVFPTGINDRSWSLEAPVHWKRKRLRFLCKVNPPRSNLPSFGKGDIVAFLPMELARESDPHFSVIERSAGDLQPGLTPLMNGDVLIAKITPCFENGKGGICTSLPNGVGFGSTEFHVLRPRKEIDVGFLYYVTVSVPFRSVGAAMMQGSAGQQRVPAGFLEDFVLSYPSVDEQKRIYDYLAAKVDAIEQCIREKQTLLGLLDEFEQLETLHAVTRGLKPKASVMESGIDWIGNIPAHWKVRRLRFVARIRTGERDTVDRQDEGPYPFYVRSQTVERIDTYSFDGEAVLTAGDGVGVAKVFHYATGKFDYHQRVYKFPDFRDIIGRFFFHYLRRTLKFEAFRETAKSTVDSLRLPVLKNFPVVLPPEPEQRHIVQWIDSKVSAVENAVACIKHEIELLRDYENNLIAEAVSGRICTRGAESRKLKTEHTVPVALSEASD